MSTQVKKNIFGKDISKLNVLFIGSRKTDFYMNKATFEFINTDRTVVLTGIGRSIPKVMEVAAQLWHQLFPKVTMNTLVQKEMLPIFEDKQRKIPKYDDKGNLVLRPNNVIFIMISSVKDDMQSIVPYLGPLPLKKE